jgi:NAD(P)-dependent dehydrogenase (short-subunit alcohol dehydrogenase family)
MADQRVESGVALVTGASRGLGAAIAKALAAAGHPVAIVDIDRDGADRVAANINASGGRAEVFVADVTDEASVAVLPALVAASLGTVAVLVPNATGAQKAINVFDLRWTDMLDQLRFFMHSPLLLIQAFAPHMAAGRIIMIGSDLANRTEIGMSAYSAAKAAQHSLVRSWARELGPVGITVNAVAPGWIPVERHFGTPSTEIDAYTARVPLGRHGVPDDIAAAVVFLASSAAAFITGEIVTVNGGHRLT